MFSRCFWVAIQLCWWSLANVESQIVFPDEDGEFPGPFIQPNSQVPPFPVFPVGPAPAPPVRPVPAPQVPQNPAPQIPPVAAPLVTCSTQRQLPGTCVTLPQCPFDYTQLGELQNQPCPLPQGGFGVCCPDRNALPSGVSSTGTLNFRPPAVPIPNLRPQDIFQAAQAAIAVFNERLKLEQQLFLQNIVVQSGTPVGSHLSLFPTSSQTLQTGNNAIKNLQASIQLVAGNKLTVDQGRFVLSSFNFKNVSTLQDTCPPTTTCPNPPAPFRSFDGSCNNAVHTDWGKVDTALQRIIPPKYGDGVNSPRVGDGNIALPSARLVSQSLTLSSHAGDQSNQWTLMLMQWGQFIDHDLTHTPLVRGQNASGITCCNNGQIIDISQRHPDCFPIEIPPNDVFFGPFNQRCMEFVRSLPAIRPRCSFGPREQLNQVTGFLDGSMVYGSGEAAARGLREFRGGRLLIQNRANPRDTLLPVKADECSDVLRQRFCFLAGDGRVNEQPQLAAMHTIWVREHNRIAAALAELNPFWDDERIYQEARRIVAAEIQHINYKDFLPILLGENYMKSFQLNPLEPNQGYNNLYDPNINPSITNEFATAAYRMGHSLVQGIMQEFSPFGSPTKTLFLHQHQFKPFELYEENGVDSLVRGLIVQPTQNLDVAFADEVKNRLFQGSSSFGLDLIALNIQRGRDHGLPPYNDYRELCGRKRAQTWEDLFDVIPPVDVDKMRRIYRTVDDVDLFIGGIGEAKADGALLGPTFQCLIGDQMARSRRGDRYFYEEGGQSYPFTLQQLSSLRQVTLARILCDNASDMKAVQLNVFLQSDVNNKRLPCDGPFIPALDLTLWRQ